VTARLHRVSALARVGLCALAVLLVGTTAGVRSAAMPAAAPAAIPAAPSAAPAAASPVAAPAATPAAAPAASAVTPTAAPTPAQVPARDGPEALAATRRLLASGAPALALLRIDRSQVPGARWVEWEALRLAVLEELGLWQYLAARADALAVAAPLPGPFLRFAWLAGAEAALRMADPALARTLAARVIWTLSPAADELRRAQVVVIESLFIGGEAPEGYRSILRFRHDTPVPGVAASARFIALIAAHGTVFDAVPLLPLLPEAHPVRIAVQAQVGLVAPAAAAAQARAAMQAGHAATADPVRDWQVLRAAARSTGETLLAVEATERLLDADPSADGAAATARALWQDYLAAAPAIANREQLLVGDVFGWSDAAARLAARDPGAARTLFAFLALKAPEPGVRATARLQFASLLREAGLGRAAIRLFLDPGPVSAEPLAADLRRLLGDTAAARRMWLQAAEFRRGLDSRSGEDAQAWRMATAELQARAGRIEDALAGTLAALPKRADLQVRAHAVADLLEDAGEAAAAARIREAAGPAPAVGAGAAPRRP